MDLGEVDGLFRVAFGALLDHLIERSRHSPETLLASARPRLTQGNITAITDMRRAKGWIDKTVATEFFRELGRGDAEALGQAYATIRSAVDGKTEPTYRRRKTNEPPRIAD